MHKNLIYKGHIYEFQTDLFLNDDDAKKKYSEFVDKESVKEVIEKYDLWTEENGYALNLNDSDDIRLFDSEVLAEVNGQYDIGQILNHFKVPFKKITTSNSEIILVTKEYALILGNNVIDNVLTLNELANEIEKHPENFIPKEIIEDISTTDFNNTFWQNPKILYTNVSSSRLTGLKKTGLHPRDQDGWSEVTKTSISYKDFPSISRDTTLKIDTLLMKQDQYMPKVKRYDTVENLPILAKIVDYYDLGHLINIPELNEDAEDNANYVFFVNVIPGKYLSKFIRDI